MSLNIAILKDTSNLWNVAKNVSMDDTLIAYRVQNYKRLDLDKYCKHLTTSIEGYVHDRDRHS